MRTAIKSLLFGAAALLTSMSAMAYTEVESLTTLSLDEIYHINEYAEITASISLPRGEVFQTGAPEIELFSDAACTQAVDRLFYSYGTLCYDGKNSITAQVNSYDIATAGTYYVKTVGTIFNDTYFTFVAEGSTAPVLQQMQPIENAIISPRVNSTGTGEVLLFFNIPMTYAGASIEINGKEVATAAGGGPAPVLPVKIGTMMRECYSNGAFAAEGGTPFTVVITGLQSGNGNKYGTDGTMRINYVAAKKDMSLVRTNIISGREFLSYYPKGDARAIFTMEFDGDVCTDNGYAPYAEFSIGDPAYENNFVMERIDPVIEGNKLTFDLSGSNRRAAISAAGIENGTPYSFKVCNVYDNEHNPAEGSSDANIGSFSYSFIYTQVEEQVIDFEFSPANGASLATATELTLWHNNAQVIESFAGLLFTYDDGDTQLIPAAELINKATEPGECEYTVTLPDKAKTAPVDVTLSNIVSLDGYSKCIKASYNKFVVTYCTPFSEGALMSEIPHDPWMADESADAADKLVHIRTNYAQTYPQMYITYEVADVTTDEVLRNTYMIRLDDGQYVGAWYAEATPLVGGHTYEARFTAWESEAIANKTPRKTLGKYVITFYGDGGRFNYSVVEFVSIDPDPAMGPIEPSQNVFTISYDGLVKINEKNTGLSLGMGAGFLPLSATAVDPKADDDGYSTTWAVTVPKSYMQGDALDLFISAYDTAGLTVKGDMLTYTDQDYKMFSYTIHNADSYKDLTITPADGSTVDEISQIKIECEMAMGFNWECAQPIAIYDGTGLVHEVVRSDDVKSEIKSVSAITGTDETGEPVYDELTHMEISLAQPITKAGAYRIVIPEQYFMLGSQFETSYNRATELQLIVDGTKDDGVNAIVIDPTTLDAQTECYTVMGQRITSSAITPGIYLLRQGTTTSKVIVK